MVIKLTARLNRLIFINIINITVSPVTHYYRCNYLCLLQILLLVVWHITLEIELNCIQVRYLLDVVFLCVYCCDWNGRFCWLFDSFRVFNNYYLFSLTLDCGKCARPSLFPCFWFVPNVCIYRGIIVYFWIESDRWGRTKWLTVHNRII